MANDFLDTLSSAARLIPGSELALRAASSATRLIPGSELALNTFTSATQLIPGGSIALGAALAGTSGAAQVGTWLGSEFAKFGRNLAGTPGEISAALLGAGTGAMTGFFLGSLLGAVSGQDMVRYFLSGLLQQTGPVTRQT